MAYIKDRNYKNETLFAAAINLPQLLLTERQLCDLELLLNGGFAPLGGFLNQDEYESVIAKERLPEGKLWPIPIVLDVRTDEKKYTIGERILLADRFGVPLAVFTIESIYKPDKKREAKAIYGTESEDHYGVNYLMNETGDMYLGGKVEGIQLPPREDFKEYRLTPQELKQWFRKNKWKKIAGFQTRNPIHKAHYTLIKLAASRENVNVLVHPTVGVTKDGDIDYITRVKTYKKVYENYLKDFAKLSLLPLAMRMAGPKEALLHALIRKNYGCTHFIIGRDHAGPGKDRKGRPFYEPYAAQEYLGKHAEEIGMGIIKAKEIVYAENRDKHIVQGESTKKDTIRSLSGTEFRRKLLSGEPIPSWFTFEETLPDLKRGLMRTQKNGLVLFFTGLSGSGKSTTALALYQKLLEVTDASISLLDGDMVRQNLSKGLGFSKEDRNENIKRIGFVAGEIARHGGIAICSAIAPYAQSRDINRAKIREFGEYVEIYMSTTLATCKKRDSKGFYKKVAKGAVKKFTGIDDPYEIPEHPEITLNTASLSTEKCVAIILKYLRTHNIIEKTK